MNPRMFPLVSLLGACNGDDEPSPDGFGSTDLVSDGLVGDDDDDDLSSESGTGVDRGFEIYFLQVEATFGWDAETHSVISVNTPYGEVPSAIVISLGDPRWARDDYASDSEDYCVVVLPLTDPSPLPNWVEFDSSLYFGFDYRASDQAITDCGTPGYEYDTQLWGDRIEQFLAQNEWGVAIGRLRDDYAANFASSPLLPHLAGGQINNTLLRTPLDEGIVGYIAVASQIDAAHNLVRLPDGTQPYLPAESIPAEGGIASGLYQLLPLFIFTVTPGP